MDQTNTSLPENSTSQSKSPELKSKKTYFVLALIVLVIIIAVVATVVAFKKESETISTEQVQKQLTDSLQTTLGRSDGLEVKFDKTSGLATVTQTDPGHDVSAQNVRIAYVLLVKMGNEVFNIDGINSIQIIEKTKFEYPEDPANAELPQELRATQPPLINDAVTIAMTKTNFKSVDWQSYKGQPIHKLITEKSYQYDINPEIEASLNENELYLDLQ